MLGPLDAGEGLSSGVTSRGGIGDEGDDMSGEFDKEGAEDKGVRGEGGTSIED